MFKSADNCHSEKIFKIKRSHISKSSNTTEKVQSSRILFDVCNHLLLPINIGNIYSIQIPQCEKQKSWSQNTVACSLINLKYTTEVSSLVVVKRELKPSSR